MGNASPRKSGADSGFGKRKNDWSAPCETLTFGCCLTQNKMYSRQEALIAEWLDHRIPVRLFEAMI